MSQKLAFKDLINSETPVLVDFYADWCAPCKMMSPIVAQVAEEFGEKIKVIKIDVDKNASVSQTYGIRSIPTFILFKKGAVVWKEVGGMSAQQLRNAVQKNL